MSTTLIELENFVIAKIEVDGARVLSNELTRQLSDALDQAEDAEPTAVLFIHVNGQLSSTGLSHWPGGVDTQSVSKWERVLHRIERANVITIVLVEGACSALALELLLVADRRLSLGNFSAQHAMRGRNLWPGMALYRLCRQIGDCRARKLYLEGTPITTTIALELGIVDETVENLAKALDRVAYFIRHAPLNDFAVCRRLMQESLSTSFDDALGAHLAACDRVIRRSP